MASSAPCDFRNTEQNLTPPGLFVRSMTIMCSPSSSATTVSLLLEDEEEVVSDSSFTVTFFTSLNTALAFLVNGRMAISEVKGEVMRSHFSTFPRFGEIKIDDIKFECQSHFHSLEDSMPMNIILNEGKDEVQLFVEASTSVEYRGDKLSHNWSDSEEEDNDAVEQEQTDDLQSCVGHGGLVTIIPCIICLRGLDASSLSPRETDRVEMCIEGLPKNPVIATELDVATDTGKNCGTQIKKRKKPTPEEIWNVMKDPNGKRHMSKQVWNSMPSFESRTKPNEENFPTRMAHEGTLQSYSSNKIATSSQKQLRSDKNSSHDSTG